MNFDGLLSSTGESVSPGELPKIPDHWGQGRTTFGGLSTALMLQRIAAKVDTERQLRAVNVLFPGALYTDKGFSIGETCLSEGRSLSQWQASISQSPKNSPDAGYSQQEKPVVCLQAVYGNERESNLDVSIDPASLPEPESGRMMPYIDGVTPAFVQHFDFSYCEGDFPFSGSNNRQLKGWMRFKEPTTTIGDSHLMALIDAWPPTVLQNLTVPCPCATVSWNVEIIKPLTYLSQPLDSRDWLFYEAEIMQAHHGFAHTEARVFNRQGEAIALSRQMIAVYDQRG